MGRRYKAPEGAHREAIAAAARELFQRRGIEATTMDDIARTAGYSKATLYVYFKNKEELVSVLVLESMRQLAAYLDAALERRTAAKDRYEEICRALLRYQEEYPLYFRLTLQAINVGAGALPQEREAFRVGEAMNAAMERFLREGAAAGEIRPALPILPTIFSFWGLLSGLIQTAANKEAYIQQSMGLSKEAFLEYGFGLLYRSIAAREETT